MWRWGWRCTGAVQQLRLYDPAGQRWLPTPQEEAAARRAAEERALVAEAEVARLRALLSDRGQSS